jgi:hypothetical protein
VILTRTEDRVQKRSAGRREFDPAAFAGSFDLIAEFRDQDLIAAVIQHDTAALFDRLMHDFSFQGISAPSA